MDERFAQLTAQPGLTAKAGRDPVKPLSFGLCTTIADLQLPG
jgi:hypothetical protein